MMNRTYGSMRLSSGEVLSQAMAFSRRVATGSLARPLRTDERQVLAALEYFVATRGGEVRDQIPIGFVRCVFSSGPSARWWKDSCPEPLPFRLSDNPGLRNSAASALSEGQFEEVGEEFIRYSVGLAVLDVADRFRVAC